MRQRYSKISEKVARIPTDQQSARESPQRRLSIIRRCQLYSHFIYQHQ